MSNVTRPTACEIQNYRDEYARRYGKPFTGNDSIIRMAFDDAPLSTPDEENAWIIERMHEDVDGQPDLQAALNAISLL